MKYRGFCGGRKMGKGKTDWHKLKSLTEEEIVKAANSDPDSPILTEDELKEFKRTMKSNEYLAVGNEELGSFIKEGDLVQANSGHIGKVEHGTDEEGNKNTLLGFITVGEDSYLVSIEGQLLPGCEKVNV